MLKPLGGFSNIPRRKQVLIAILQKQLCNTKPETNSAGDALSVIPIVGTGTRIVDW